MERCKMQLRYNDSTYIEFFPKFRVHWRFWKFWGCFGWFRGEEFILFNLQVECYHPDMGFIASTRIQIAKFCIELGIDT